MLNKNLQDEIVVKTKQGDFRLLKDGKLNELPTDELLVRQDDIVVHSPIAISKPIKSSANFYFNVEDEKEVQTVGGQPARNIQIKNFIENTINSIIKEAGLEPTENQLKSVVNSRLRNVRSLAETKEALMRIASLASDSNKVEQLVVLIEKKRKDVEEIIQGKTGSSKLTANMLSAVEKKPIEKKPEIKEQKINKKTGDVKYKKDEEVKLDLGHKVTGPIEEIRDLSLKDFRRLGNNPKEAIDKVLDKIDLLEDESITKKAEGIQAWKQSEVHQLYLTIGAESISQKKSVEQTIQARQKQGKTFLTTDEFNEIADLNKQLSY